MDLITPFPAIPPSIRKLLGWKPQGPLPPSVTNILASNAVYGATGSNFTVIFRSAVFAVAPSTQ